MDRSIVIGHGIKAELADATYIHLREVVHDNMCFYDADTREISYAPAPPRVYAAGSFAGDGTAINNVAYSCSCTSYTMIEDKSAPFNPFGFGRRPEPGDNFGPNEPGHYKIKFTKPLTHVNYSITIQPQAVLHYLQLTSDVVERTQDYFTFRICDTPNSIDEAFNFTVFDYNNV